MAKQTRPFDGHFDGDDPRWVTTAAGGCTWPTIPAHRYMLMSDNATLSWWHLRFPWALFQRTSPASSHDQCTWGLYSTTYPITWAWFDRLWIPAEQRIKWHVEIMTIDCYFPAIADFYTEPGACNGEVQLGDMTCIAALGSTGDHMKLIPVQFDKTTIEDP